MRYALALLVLSGISFYAFRHHPASTVVTKQTTPTATSTPGRDFLKRPLDRTRAVLDQVRTGRDSESF